MKSYVINEIFYSLQGEGIRAGSANLFLRFSGCNETCRTDTHGFDCDTEFDSGMRLTVGDARGASTASGAATIVEKLRGMSSSCRWIVLTGGEPALQVDRELINQLHAAGYKLAIETNGSIELPPGLDWITVSPKMAEGEIRQRVANEVKYVRAKGQPIPETVVDAEHKLISPAFVDSGSATGTRLEQQTLDWCIKLVRENPEWCLSVQQHKWWKIR